MSTVEQGAQIAPPVGVQFQLTVLNRSSDRANVMLFPSVPAGTPGHPVVWRSFELLPEETSMLHWRHTLNFVRGGLTDFAPGRDYEPVEIISAVPGESNQVTLSLVGGELAFTDPRPGPPGTLLVEQDPSVPPRAGNVGVGIGGFGTLISATQAGTRQSYGYAPQFYVGTGTYQEGEFLSTMGIDTQAALNYPVGVTEATALFDGNGWVINY
ncbi:hypothetical protein [Saccharothrix australiensis]|uniref:Uncharacterized protein n=1 Tax=Saccharothrix australiensis TaxID=2072 RepID=A0A495VTW8_9PSEU|nr:hypothetical protein [Saccharothrix australiensis]RKT52789.1 hypothetical protein C8E97_1324 [Saccharothrix australiensis]